MMYHTFIHHIELRDAVTFTMNIVTTLYGFIDGFNYAFTQSSGLTSDRFFLIFVISKFDFCQWKLIFLP